MFNFFDLKRKNLSQSGNEETEKEETIEVN